MRDSMRLWAVRSLVLPESWSRSSLAKTSLPESSKRRLSLAVGDFIGLSVPSLYMFAPCIWLDRSSGPVALERMGPGWSRGRGHPLTRPGVGNAETDITDVPVVAGCGCGQSRSGA